jgi:hypothetical protein
MHLLLFLQLSLTQPTLEAQYTTELTQHAEDFLHDVRLTRGYASRLAVAHKIIPIVIKHCLKYDVDPLMVAVVMQKESSWGKNLKGDLGEVGPMHVMPRYFKQFDLTTLDSQIEAGVSHLAVSRDKCGGNVAKTFQYYGSNRCGPISWFARHRQRVYYRAVKKYRGEVVEP